MNNRTPPSSYGYNLVEAARQPLVYSFSIAATLIVTTSILNFNVLYRRVLRSSACTCYFMAAIPPVLIYVLVSPISLILQYGFQFIILDSPIMCRVIPFFIYTAPLWYGLMLVCASIDRFFSSSESIRLRRLSQVYVARRIILIVWILSTVYMCPFLIIYYYDSGNAGNRRCLQYSTILVEVYLMSRVILYYILIPIMLSIFGAWTIYNIRCQKHRVAPIIQASPRRRTEGQLARMMIIQVGVYLLFFTPSAITYIIVTLIPSMNTPYYITIRSITVVWQQGGFFISFFLYVFTGNMYRKELKKMIQCK
ncbi:unnamed protein product [Adineta ricciae]|uniref:G-protein coupled receptors family 1 profile domain-containing protein n=1 Tax=Adineta ricciae TaxID=249248 RepID=A0A815GFF9_ADIRI|nr:unnamed protein product [Adineta ricciae]CAF1339091.1 unnamed protein product [Adineta ricciae]